MKKLMTICLITAVATSITSAVPVLDDLWDTSKGAAVTASSGTRNWASNMFGTNGGGLDANTTIFNDWIGYGYHPYPIGTEHWVEWRTAADITLGSFKLYAAHDGVSNAYARSFDHFSLLAKISGASDFTEIYSTDIAVPYDFIDDEEGFLAQHTFAAPVIAQDFKAVFRQHTAVFWASGPRVAELDGFAVPEPTTICLLGLGALSFLRRKK
jgi:hypothetical protein